MRILIFNWKDIKNPTAGGAEILTHEMAKRFVKKGHKVTLFTSEFPFGLKKENIDGVIVYRQGGLSLFHPQQLVFVKAYLFYKKLMEKNIDIVIDEIHGIPFFTPFYVKEKKIAFICEVAQNIWASVFPFPLSVVGQIVEKFYFMFYSTIPFMTISPSSKEDLQHVGVSEKNITILPMGINKYNFPIYKKEKNPTAIFVGRLSKMKGLEDAIKAFAYVVEEFPKAKLWIVGSGEPSYLEKLKNKSQELLLKNNIEFKGYVSQEKKFQLMSKAWCIIVPSIKEGFGLIVPEAGSKATPAIAFNVQGLKDVIKNNKNGFLVDKRTPQAFASAIVRLFRLFSDKKQYKSMTNIAKEESKAYNWENTARVAINFLQKEIK